ncbi:MULTISPECIES: hypothetical protein [Pseudomonadati]|uniref:ATPase n=1 Tax=Shewanella aestuarii TaxID=1028752 RepID=A0ABT0KZQ8_9GAMM|nr:hypothetical protein [Shewanella aestuarii]MCL1116662.1 hypothetical protein [Shewanella aestuarii]GGN72625.1 hypothetical protein GCM10009193_09710 [Shewanella aestuarii]
MRIQQLSELLEYVANCRLGMSKLYKRLHRNADSSRVKLMLEYFQQHEQHIYDTLESYIEDAPAKILDTWYQDVVFEDFLKRCDETSLPANMDEEQLLELHLDLENRLIALLEKTAELTSSNDAKSALLDVIRVAQTQQKRLVHSVLRMDDI